MSQISHPHDKYFKTMLSNKAVAKDFLEWHLPDFIKSKIDLDSVEAQKDSFVDDNFKKLETDILFSADFDGKPGYIYTLVEAQRKPERLMPLRIIKYLIAIIEHHIKENGGEDLPLVYPMILYQGEKPWNHPTNFFELFSADNTELAKQIFTGDFQLVDIHRIPDEEFKKHFWAGVFEAAIKWGETRDIINTLSDLKPELIKIFDLNKGALVATLTYLGNVGDADVEKLIEWGKNVEPIGDEVMTLAKKLETRGANQQKFDIAENMLKDGVDIQRISQYTELSIKEIEELKAKNEKGFEN
jgi:predicted transposase/invertase (TIGR01784 family)